LTVFGAPAIPTTQPPAATAVLGDNPTRPAPPRLFREPDVEELAAPLDSTAPWPDSEERRTIAALTPNTLNLFGIAAARGYESAIPSQLTSIWPKTNAELMATLRLLSVQYLIVSDETASQIGGLSPGSRLSHPLPSGSLLRVHAVLPRVYMPGRVQPLPPAEIPSRMGDPAVVSGREVLLAEGDSTPILQAEEAPEPRPCTLTDFTNTRVAATCLAPAPTMAVFVEQYDPGWTATVDGRPAPIVAANLVMRAVPISAGHHTIDLQYKTPGLTLALSLSLLGVVALALISILGL